MPPVAPWVRVAAMAATGLLAFVLLLVAKLYALPLFLRYRLVATLVALLAFLGAVLLAKRVFRASALTASSASAVFAFLLVVDLIVSPLPYELAHHAGRLPHPEGAFGPDVDTAPVFEANHPIAYVSFHYPDGTNMTGLTERAAQRFRDEGWAVEGLLLPESASGGFGSFGARKGGFVAYCTLGDRNGVLLSCSLSV